MFWHQGFSLYYVTCSMKNIPSIISYYFYYIGEHEISISIHTCSKLNSYLILFIASFIYLLFWLAGKVIIIFSSLSNTIWTQAFSLNSMPQWFLCCYIGTCYIIIIYTKLSYVNQLFQRHNCYKTTFVTMLM